MYNTVGLSLIMKGSTIKIFPLYKLKETFNNEDGPNSVGIRKLFLTFQFYKHKYNNSFYSMYPESVLCPNTHDKL